MKVTLAVSINPTDYSKQLTLIKLRYVSFYNYALTIFNNDSFVVDTYV